jgi:hypothetical protein
LEKNQEGETNYLLRTALCSNWHVAFLYMAISLASGSVHILEQTIMTM